jgi:CRP-like cAMP-binding protein
MQLPAGNRIVDGMISSESRAIFDRATVLELDRAQVTTVDSRRMLNVDFPITAILSVVGTLADGSSVEITNVGSEGFVEIDAALNHPIAKRTSICLFPGTVVRLPIDEFVEALHRDRAFADHVYHAIRARTFVTEQLALCGVRHTTDERLARWLLLTAFKLNSDTFMVTHEALAGILGVRRASISIAARQFHEAGVLHYRRGRVTITDSSALESLACPCFHECVTALGELL